jgi:hypothetical protein
VDTATETGAAGEFEDLVRLMREFADVVKDDPSDEA